MNAKRILLIGITSLLGMTITLGGCSMEAKESTVSEKYPTKPITNNRTVYRRYKLRHTGKGAGKVSPEASGSAAGSSQYAWWRSHHRHE
ncbi:hypothetical protein SPSIL_026210 [Sporomusa silvacetica DSM 10669]|uniref:Uncharacterized protein n=1 Tax=Sporomusa silvacetica DSM 10669 TaxID=1123289 RepID=A0ABZ3ILB7_9FIRM|nr:hypothetical protein SPSIL_03560 [Sporomusa silvacetica DSM 10669]